jgi:SNF2 family DNA or RNA helicase
MRLSTRLYSHQRDAVEKVLPSRVAGLFMEMGTGKTRTAIELVYRRRERVRRVVWLCPVSLKRTIAHEIQKHTDAAEADVYVFDDRTALSRLPGTFWYVVGLESLSASTRVVLTLAHLIDEDTFVVLDESTYIKGHRALRTRRATQLAARARYRLILTGTPLTQGVVDLYAQMRFLSPRILGYHSFYSFAANHLVYSEQYPGMIVRTLDTEYLAARVQPYVYQVTKEECVDLPSKIHKRRWYPMTSDQRALYDRAKTDMLRAAAADPDDRLLILRLFTALQQVACGYYRFRDEGGEWQVLRAPHQRLRTLADVVRNIPAGEKVVVWAKYHRDIRRIARALEREHGTGCVAQFHGRLSERQRNAELERFRGPARFFVATQAAGGHGLTLNEAAHVVFYSNSFKYSERLQAEDRCHRIGQTRHVTYVDIVCERSIDERILEVLDTKGSVVENFRQKVERIKRERGLSAAEALAEIL